MATSWKSQTGGKERVIFIGTKAKKLLIGNHYPNRLIVNKIAIQKEN